jgi:hypothetical protein
MIAGIPQMQGPELTETVDEPLVLELTGPGTTTVTVLPAADHDKLLTIKSGAAGVMRIRSTALDFVNWGTTRKPWRDYCEIEGNARSATRFLDKLNIV